MLGTKTHRFSFESEEEFLTPVDVNEPTKGAVYHQPKSENYFLNSRPRAVRLPLRKSPLSLRTIPSLIKYTWQGGLERDVPIYARSRHFQQISVVGILGIFALNVYLRAVK